VPDVTSTDGINDGSVLSGPRVRPETDRPDNPFNSRPDEVLTNRYPQETEAVHFSEPGAGDGGGALPGSGGPVFNSSEAPAVPAGTKLGLSKSSLHSLTPNNVSRGSTCVGKHSSLRVLYLFSGPQSRPQSLAAYARSWGNRIGVKTDVEEYDILNGAHQDLSDDHLFNSLCKRLRAGEFDSIFMSPPCSSFGCRRHDGGPPPLRGLGFEIYGKAGLTPEQSDRVRFGTLLALRSAEVAKLALAQSVPWLVEQPMNQEGRPHMFLLFEWAEILKLEGVNRFELDQCMLDCEFKKPTVLVGTVPVEFARRCSHATRWFRTIPQGKWIKASHPPLAGKLKAVPAECWKEEYYNLVPSSEMPFLTKATANYPAAMNEVVARALVNAAVDFRTLSNRRMAQGQSERNVVRKLSHSEWGVGKQSVQFASRLRSGAQGSETKDEQAEKALGGLRHPARSVSRLPYMSEVGISLRDALESYLNKHPDLVARAVSAIGVEDTSSLLPSEDIAEIRKLIFRTFNCRDAVPRWNPNVPTPVNFKLLEAWRFAAGDPDKYVCEWFEKGAPAGLTKPIETCGVFPVSSQPPEFPDLEITDAGNFVNYAGVDESDEAWEEISSLVRQGLLASFDSYEEVVAHLKCKPTISRVGVLEKVSAGGVIKRRVIVDSAQSGISKATTKPERVVLPRLLDVVNNCLFQLSHCWSEHFATELFVLDFTNAFFNVPLHEDERKHFCITLRGKWYVFKVQAQGAGGSPLVWGRVAALVTRLTQSLFHPEEVLLQTFVDDPIGCLTGSRRQRNLWLAIIVLVWSALGFKLAFKKGQRGPEVVWIGGTIKVSRAGVEASIKQSILDCIREQLREILKSNVCSRKLLRSFAGRCNHVATLLWPWRPFLQSLWAAISSDPAGAPHNCIWVKQISVSLHWIGAFLDGASGSLQRTFSREAYLGAGVFVQITLDASPWGLGGVLQEDGETVSWFASALSDFDYSFFGYEQGSSKGQQCWEALAALVAMRLWKTRWRSQRVRIAVRGDSLAMLTVLLKFKAPSNSRALGIIAREVALDVAESCYAPDFTEHIPGITNKTADILSRLDAPAKPGEERPIVPQWLLSFPRAFPPARALPYFRALTPEEILSSSDSSSGWQ
jgi:hypothetical protein